MDNCDHDWRNPGATLVFRAVFDDWLGPVAGLCRCSQCGDHAVAYLQAWQGSRLDDRVFAVRQVPARAVDIYTRNMSSDYCDLTRKQAETDALMSSASPESLLVRVSLEKPRVEGTQPAGRTPPVHNWRDIEAGGCNDLVPADL